MSIAAIASLEPLYLAAVEARKSYVAEYAAAEARSMGALFRDMIVLHSANAHELKRQIDTCRHGIPHPEDPALDATTQYPVVTEGPSDALSAVSPFGVMGDCSVAGVVQQEQQHVKKYDDALRLYGLPNDVMAVLRTQRDRLALRTSMMN